MRVLQCIVGHAPALVPRTGPGWRTPRWKLPSGRRRWIDEHGGAARALLGKPARRRNADARLETDRMSTSAERPGTRTARLLLVAGLAVAGGCGPRGTPAPAPTPVPTTPPPTARAPRPTDSARVDSARGVPIRRDTTRRDTTRRVEARRAPARPAAPPRVTARIDTLPLRSLRAPVRVCAGGDVTLGTNLDTAWTRVASERLRTRFRQRDDPASLLMPLRPLVADAEIVLLNVESAIGSGRVPTKCGAGSSNCFAFRAPPSSAAALRALRRGGTVVGNIANNHARDAGSEGRDSTIAALARAGVVVTGTDSIATAVPTAG